MNIIVALEARKGWGSRDKENFVHGTKFSYKEKDLVFCSIVESL